MLVSRLTLLASVIAVTLGSAASAHEYWIDPVQYQVEAGGTVEAELRNGEMFSGIRIPFLTRNNVRLDYAVGGTVADVPGRSGDLPAIRIENAPEGLMVITHRSRLSKLTYKEMAKFENFVTHKDLGDALTLHAARGLPDGDFREGYTRFPKALIAVGSGAGSDREMGLETEIVAMANPYTDDLGGKMPVRLLYLTEPRADAQIEVFERAPDDTVTSFFLRTDQAGLAEVPVKAGHDYLLDAVVLRVPDAPLAEAEKIDWESLWATITFSVPETR